MARPYTFTSASTDLATTNDYVDIPIGNELDGYGVYLLTTSSGPISVNWKNTGDETINSRVLGSNDKDAADADWHVVGAVATIATGVMRHYEEPIAYYQFYKFQHEALVDDTHGASELKGRHSRV